MHMKSGWLLILVALALLVPMMGCLGCSDFHASKAMAATIDQNAAVGQADQVQALAGTLTPDVAKAKIATNAATFAGYAAAKTTNPFAYWFGGKGLWVSGEYATRLDALNTLAADANRRASSQPAAGYLNAVIVKEARALQDVKDAKDGKPSAP
jgi:hypothetical protein